MSSRLLFNFLVDKESSTITITREFMAHRQLVWDCYTKSELLDQWFAPEPLTTRTKSMDFREGGHWHYAMVEPNGKEYWGLTEYLTIKPIDFYTALDAFSNEKGDINTHLPRATWKVTFTDKDNNAIVHTLITYNSLEDLETVLKMGMKDGMASTLERLDHLLLALNKQ
uniref:SRPBCC domain-containing protein n=1 Tax=Roseihalotalea indica TaxID=2867963 RepID=A0AA49GQV9_9BACT|nr:SRPBCC domain-containing protein [Tunicatimonas sp. TK19036]